MVGQSFKLGHCPTQYKCLDTAHTKPVDKLPVQPCLFFLLDLKTTRGLKAFPGLGQFTSFSLQALAKFCSLSFSSLKLGGLLDQKGSLLLKLVESRLQLLKFMFPRLQFVHRLGALYFVARFPHWNRAFCYFFLH